MTSRDFCYWLQGFFEINGGSGALKAHHVKMVKQHLAMVFVHEIDPSMGDVKAQQALNDIHTGAHLKRPPPLHNAIIRC